MARTKKILKMWDKKHKYFSQEDIKEVENKIDDIYGKSEKGVFNIEEVENLRLLEGNKDSLLKSEEKMWKLKSRALWLKEGEKNTKYFHRYASYRKNIINIFEIRKGQGKMENPFRKKWKQGSSIFKTYLWNRKVVQYQIYWKF